MCHTHRWSDTSLTQPASKRNCLRVSVRYDLYCCRTVRIRKIWETIRYVYGTRTVCMRPFRSAPLCLCVCGRAFCFTCVPPCMRLCVPPMCVCVCVSQVYTSDPTAKSAVYKWVTGLIPSDLFTVELTQDSFQQFAAYTVSICVCVCVAMVHVHACTHTGQLPTIRSLQGV